MQETIKLEKYPREWQVEIMDISFADLEKSSEIWKEYGTIGLLIWSRLNAFYERY